MPAANSVPKISSSKVASPSCRWRRPLVAGLDKTDRVPAAVNKSPADARDGGRVPGAPARHEREDRNRERVKESHEGGSRPHLPDDGRASSGPPRGAADIATNSNPVSAPAEAAIVE